MKTLSKLAILLLTASALFGYSQNQISTSSTVQVQSSDPVHRTVVVRKPYQECYDAQVQSNSNGTFGALLGGAAGGVLGHQVGGGSGKTAATIGGAIIGTLVGKNMAKSDSYSTQRRCTTKYTETREDRITGYKNIGYIGSTQIIKYSSRPLKFIKTRTTVSW